MDLFTLIGLAAAGAAASFTVRSFDSSAGRNIAAATCALIALSALAHVSGIVDRIREIAAMGGIPGETVLICIKAVGIAYLAKLTSSLCTDLGESSLAASCDLVGRLMLLALALPLVRRLGEMLIALAEKYI